MHKKRGKKLDYWALSNKAIYGAILLILVFSVLTFLNQQVVIDEEIPLGAPALRGSVLVGTSQEISDIGTIKKEIEAVEVRGLQIYSGNIVISEEGWKEVKNKLDNSNIGWIFAARDKSKTKDNQYKLFVIPAKKGEYNQLASVLKKKGIPYFVPASPKDKLFLKYSVTAVSPSSSKKEGVTKKKITVLPLRRNMWKFYDVYFINKKGEVEKKETQNWAVTFTKMITVKVEYADGSKETIVAEYNPFIRKIVSWSDVPVLKVYEGDAPFELVAALQEPLTKEISSISESIATSFLRGTKEGKASEKDAVKIIYLDYPLPLKKDSLSSRSEKAIYENLDATKSIANYFLNNEKAQTPKGFTYSEWFNAVADAGIEVRMPSPEYLKFLVDLRVEK